MNTVNSLNVSCVQTEVCNSLLSPVLQFFCKLFVHIINTQTVKTPVSRHYSAKNTISTELLFSTMNGKVILLCKNQLILIAINVLVLTEMDFCHEPRSSKLPFIKYMDQYIEYNFSVQMQKRYDEDHQNLYSLPSTITLFRTRRV